MEHRLTERLGQAPQMLWSDDGIVIRLPEAHDHVPMEDILINPEDIEDLVVRQLPGTPYCNAYEIAVANASIRPEMVEPCFDIETKISPGLPSSNLPTVM